MNYEQAMQELDICFSWTTQELLDWVQQVKKLKKEELKYVQ